MQPASYPVNTIYLFTSGRYEYRNKGMDLFIEAMARLKSTIACSFWVLRWRASAGC